MISSGKKAAPNQRGIERVPGFFGSQQSHAPVQRLLCRRKTETAQRNRGEPG
jgi:hypothetical protein